MKITLNSGKVKELEDMLPADFLDVDEEISFSRKSGKSHIEARIQECVVRFFRSFIKPFHQDCRLICNPFAESDLLSSFAVGRAKRVGFSKSQSDTIFLKPMGGYSFFCMEIKTLKSGGITKDKKPTSKHTRDQSEFLKDTEKNGAKSIFTIGLKDSIIELCKYFEVDEKIFSI